jgi:acyl-CoA reductase-like NAD-dependent aldehyde dehydrogenase
LGELLRDIFPAGVINVVSGDDLSGNHSVGQLLVESPDINLVSFTGSVATGKKIMAACAANMTRVLLELGGNDPAIVLADADIPHASRGIYYMSMGNSGQICCAIKRVYVHRSIFDEFVQRIVAHAKEGSNSIGEGTVDGVKMGPLNNRLQRDRVVALINDAVANGGKVEVGGRVPPHVNPNGFFLEPTIITNVHEGIRIVDEEQFGPVLPIMPFDTEDEVIQRANDSKYGLGASVWGRDAVVMNRILSQLDAGIVWANEHAVLREGGPFGGMKNSGFRREGDFAESDLDAYTEIQTVKFAKVV